jgi:hypothetical protein
VSTDLEATVLLCDSAQAQGGKLYVLGGGWTRLQANTAADVALAIVVHVPWDRSNQKIRLEAVLRDDDGSAVELDGATVVAGGEFEVGRPPGLKQGERINFPLVISFNGIALPPGGYVWECTMDGETVARWPFRAG